MLKVTVTAAAETHLQTYERKKLVWKKKQHTATGVNVPDEQVMGELLLVLEDGRILIPWPLTRMGGSGQCWTTFFMALPLANSWSSLVPR